MTEDEERAALHARLRAILPGCAPRDPAQPIEQLRRYVATCEAAAEAVARHGRLGAVWRHDDECARLTRR